MAKKAEIIRAEDLPVSPAKLRARTKDLTRALGECFYELGQNLYEIKTGELYLEWEFGSFQEYVELELDFEIRKVEHYISIWLKFSHNLGIPWDEVKSIGWSKLSRIEGVIENRTDAKRWLTKAEKHSRRELETLVKEYRAKQRGEEPEPPKQRVEKVPHDVEAEIGQVGIPAAPFVETEISYDDVPLVEEAADEPVALHEFKALLFPAQWANVMAAMQRGAQIANTEKLGALLDLICAEFNTTYAETQDGGVAHRLDWHVKNLERIFEIKIAVEVPAKSRLRKMSRLEKLTDANAKDSSQDNDW